MPPSDARPGEPEVSGTGELHEHVAELFDADPILASERGYDGGAARLGDVTPEAFGELTHRQRRRLNALETTPDPTIVGSRGWLERQVLGVELRTALAEAERAPAWQRAPYWYPERLGAALAAPMAAEDAAAGAEALLGRLHQLPGYCRQAVSNLTDACPPLWAQMGVSAAQGLERFVAGAVSGYAAQLPDELARHVRGAVAAALPALAEFTAELERLQGRAQGEWACGREHFDFLLRRHHLLEMDSGTLAEYGRELVHKERNALADLAGRLDPARTWQEQIDRIKDDHPEPDRFLDTYAEAMDRSREHAAAHELITIPDGAECELDWVPEYRREGLPLGVMDPSPPYQSGLRSRFLITPVDPFAPPERRRQHARDNCYVFATSIAGHETFPGHHLQYVHHKLGTARASFLRYFKTPQFVEGWGLYVEDLLEETGFMSDPGVRLLKQRNALWRALRIVVDVGLHTGELTVPQATELMQREAGMEQHMAAGEVRRYTRHDNPTYPSSYTLGKDLIHQLRGEQCRRLGEGFTLRGFHDALLAHGSPPLALLRPVLGR